MIKINRARFPSPLNANLVVEAQQRMRDFYAVPPERRRQQKLDYREFEAIGREAHESLLRLFQHKCAYCETYLGGALAGGVDRFRPFADASELSGAGSPDHYAWLHADWENLYVACLACARAKRSLFPVDGERAPVMTPLSTVRQIEKALLVDPCSSTPALTIRPSISGSSKPVMSSRRA